MDLDAKELKHLGLLSRIKVLKKDEENYLKKLMHIIEYIGKLGTIDTKGIKPTSQVTNLENVLREDSIEPSLSQQEAIANSKHTYKGYFKVPKVVE